MPIIIGIAQIRTREITNDSFLESPLMAPEVAIAAETPHIDTALDIIMVSSLSTFNFLQSQNAKYHTEITTIRDCNRPYDPAFKISENIMLVPNRTRPIFTN